METKSVDDMTRKEFWDLPSRKWNEDIGSFDSFVILPTRSKHDSGYRCMDFVAVKGSQAICRLSGCSDALHIDGIGGYGIGGFGTQMGCPTNVPPKGWTIDCLGKSGLLRLFSPNYPLVAGPSVSSFEVFGDKD